MLVHEFLELSADRQPDKIALIVGDKRLSYRQLEHDSNCLANALMAGDLKKQDRVAVLVESSAEAVISVFGILKAGGVFSVINPQVKARKVEYILNDCQARVLITDQAHLAEISLIKAQCPFLKRIVLVDAATEQDRKIFPGLESWPDFLAESQATRPKKRCIDIDLASLIYTSGSTGIPKGVMLTHLNMVSAANSIITYLENTADDIILDVLPLSFDYGLYQVLMAFKFGGSVVLEKSFLYPYRIIELLIREKITGFPIVPTIAAILLKLKNLDKHDFPDLRYITNTAQALPPRHISELRRIFPQAKIFSMYGLTECKRVSYLPPAEIDRRPKSVGIAMPNTEAYIVDEAGNRIEEPWTTGELVVRGANVMRGYWNLPEETDKALRPGPIPGEKVLFTGDLFQMDEEGFLYFVSRKDDLIKVAGERVSPKEIENVLCEIEDVSEACVVGVDDEVLGQAIKAYLVLKKDSVLKEEDILRFCSRNLENFMIPKYIEFREELPKSAHGKINKTSLKQRSL